MSKKTPSPGVSRQDRISDDGLQRLERQLARGARINTPVLAQWIRRYGEQAREIIKRHGQYSTELDSV
ncbi:MAG: hypothetical protein EP297_01530 [Gammaproteobacteria bacterium]|nr:MAG: hypothetical protein EP297_01530 [Gammaproteobacteria bacterium]